MEVHELVTLEISDFGCTINGKHSSKTKLDDFSFVSEKSIVLRIENKPDAEYIGGFNLFGKKFGDFEQDISISFVYSD